MIEEHCPCHLHRLLVRYEEGASVIDLLSSKAGVTMLAILSPEGEVRTEVAQGSAKCIRRRCKLLRRN